MSQLNPQQQRAVQTTEGRILILAGAGSGKTSVLTHRIGYLIKEKKVPPESILGLTFTNKAAGEMRHRVGELINPKLAKKVTLCTFHSFCMQVLRKEIHHLGYTSHFSLYDEKDVKRLTSQLARHLLECEGEMPSLETTLSTISSAKNKGLSAEEILPENPNWHDKFTRDLFSRLQTCMRAYNAVDFDSLLSLTAQLFQDYPQVLEGYQDRFRYVMIDEYQDTNPVQYKLASLIAAKHRNLCVVGDDDQSIYGWRGAEIKHILEFEADVVIKLEQNYRSTPIILNAANAVISHNEKRHPKELWSTRNDSEPITMFHAPGEQEEAQSVVMRMIWLNKHKKLPWNEMAVLYRSNILSRPFEMALIQAVWEKEGKWIRGIPYQIFGGTELYERSEIKDLIAYLKAIMNPLDQESLLRIINVPRRGISDNTLDLLTQANRSQNVPLWNLLKNLPTGLREQLSDRALSGIQSFVKIVETAQEKFQTPPLHTTLEWLLEEIDYKKVISEDVKSDKMQGFKWENILQCVEAMAAYEKEAEEASLPDFLGSTLLDREKLHRHEKNLREDKVNVMTFHSAKGLEFTACFLVGLEDHIIPHEKSLMETGIEEERRLMYVALTRAKKHLTLSMARTRKRMGKETSSNPSRFLFEIPKESLKITSWQTV